MIELINIFLQFLTFLVMFSFPFNTKILNRSLNLREKNLSLIDSHALNIIFFIYLSLLVSFFQIDLRLFFKIYLLISIVFILLNLKWFLTQANRKNFFKFIFFFLVVFSIFIFIAQNIRIEWDGHVWIEKALIFFNNNEISKLNDTILPNYPYLGSYIWAFFWKNSLLEIEYFGRYFFVYFYIVSIFLVLKLSNFKNDFIKFFLILFLILITFEPYYFGGYQEYLIFSTLLVASRYLFILNSDNRNVRLFFLIFLLLYINCWFKIEGGMYFVIFTGALIYFSNVSINKKILFFLLAFLLLLIKYLIQKYLIMNLGPSEIKYFKIFFNSLSDIKFLIINILKIFTHLFIGFIKHPLWIIILLSLFLQIFILKKINDNTRFFLVCFILNIGIIFAVYIGMGNLDFNLRVTLDRVLFQTSGFYLALFFGLLNSQKIKL